MSHNRTFCSRVQGVSHLTEILRLLHSLILRGLYVGWEAGDLEKRNLKSIPSLTQSAREKARGVSVWLH